MNSRKNIALLLLIILGITTFIGFMGTATEFPLTVVDDRNKQITIEAVPQTIVVAGVPLYVEILCDLDTEDKIVGLTSSPNLPEEVQDIPTVGPSYKPSIEEIVKLNPDIIFGAWGEVREKLERAGFKVITTGSAGGWIKSLPGLFQTIHTVGKVVDKELQASKMTGQMAEQVVQIESKVIDKQPVKTAFVFVYSQGPPYASGAGALENELMLRAGGRNVFSDLAGAQKVSYEEIIKRNPEVIFTDPSQIQNINDNDLLSKLKAVKEGRVIGIKASNITSTRTVDALKKMAQGLHPAVFEEK